MKNAAIVKALPNLKSLKHEHEALKRQIKNLLKQEQQLQREVDLLSRVTEIFEGVALQVSENRWDKGAHMDVHAVDYDIDRWADVYPNAHTDGKDWGIHLRFTGQGPNREKWAGTGWPYAEACLVARRFVAHGTEPNEKWVDMIRMRHALDPKREAPRRRVLAFEAAYEAGHVELAKELLLGKAKLDKRVAQLARERAKEEHAKGQANV